MRATSTLERPVVMGTAEVMDTERFRAAMEATALEWTEDERRPFAGVLARLGPFLSAMKWKAPATILMVKASDRLMEGFPHTRGNAIVIQEGVLREMLGRPAMVEFFVVHEAFHVLSRANPGLREELYSAIGFRACGSVALPKRSRGCASPTPMRQSRHAISVDGRRPVEVLPFVHFASEKVDPKAGFVTQMQTSWLVVERRQDGRVARDEGATLEELEGLRSQAATTPAT